MVATQRDFGEFADRAQSVIVSAQPWIDADGGIVLASTVALQPRIAERHRGKQFEFSCVAPSSAGAG